LPCFAGQFWGFFLAVIPPFGFLVFGSLFGLF